MLNRLRPAFWVCLAVFLAHQLLQKGLHADLPFVDDYLDPFLSIPILLGALTQERGFLVGRTRLTAWETGVSTVAIALVCEYLFPVWSDRFFYDAWDFVAYGLGGVFFWYFVNPLPAPTTERA